MPAVKDGCRFHGSLTVNKVAGNFHITAGKYVITRAFLQVSCLLLFAQCYVDCDQPRVEILQISYTSCLKICIESDHSKIGGSFAHYFLSLQYVFYFIF